MNSHYFEYEELFAKEAISLEMSMGFKKTTRSLDFADLALATCLEQNRSIKNKFDAWFRQAAFNVAKGMKILSRVAV